MFFGAVTVLAFLASLLMRRPLRALIDRDLHHLRLLAVAIGLQLLFVPSQLEPLLSVRLLPQLPPVGGMLYTTSLSLLVVFAFLNRHVLGVAVIGVGLLMNTVVIAANGGHMPVDPRLVASEAEPAGLFDAETPGVWYSHGLLHEGTRFPLLGDWIPAPMPYGELLVLSPGDFVIALGVLLFFLVIPESRFYVSSDWLRRRISQT